MNILMKKEENFMDHNEKELVYSMARYIFAKSVKDRSEVVSYYDIAEHFKVSIEAICRAARCICEALMTSSKIADTEIYDNEGIQILLK